VSLAAVIDHTTSRLSTALGGAAGVSDRQPLALTDLPHVAVSVSDAERPQIGIGGMPQGPVHGALEVTATIDLADPTLESAGETIVLLDAARRRIVLPNGPLVAADGSEGPPFGPDDLSVTDPDGPFAITNDPPTGRQVRPLPDEGILEFGQALPNAGSLVVVHRVGVWDVTVVRYAGRLHLDITTDDIGDATTVAHRVADVLDGTGPPYLRLVPSAWGPAEAREVADTAVGVRRLSYAFVFELHRATLPTSGGIIRVVDVTSHADSATEQYQIPM
jgi:hypothetical protein